MRFLLKWVICSIELWPVTSVEKQLRLFSKNNPPLSSRSLLPHLRGVEPYDPPTTVLVQRSEPQGVSTILSSTDFFQSERNRRVILEQVDSFQLREKYMFATTTRVRRPGAGGGQLVDEPVLIEPGLIVGLILTCSLFFRE